MVREKIRFYSLVGMRETPVCMPVFHILKKDKKKKAFLTLVPTSRTLSVAEKTSSFLKDEFNDRIETELITYNDFLLKLKSSDIEKDALFNLTPAMNWQVSETVLHLPETTRCLHIDYKYIYQYTLRDGIMSQKKEKLKNLSLEAYLKLNNHIKITKTPSPHRLLIQNGIEKPNGFKINLEGISSKYLNWINHCIVWVMEQHGFLYLLFDLTSRGLPEELKKNKEFLKLYRFLTIVFDQLNYSVTVIVDEKASSSSINNLKERAGLDGYTVLRENRQDIEQWFSRPPEPKKLGMPISIKTAFTQAINRIKSSSGNTLITCLGDNVETTLKAMVSHRKAHGVKNFKVFYDKNSERLVSLAHRLQGQSLYLGGTIELLETDHLGTGIIEKVLELQNALNTRFYFNITPGTKAQTVALTEAASLCQCPDRVYSIDKDKIRAILSGKVEGQVDSPGAEQVFTFYCPYFNPHTSEILETIQKNHDFYMDLLEGLSTGAVQYRGKRDKGQGLYGLYRGKGRYFDIQINDDKIKVHRIHDGRTFVFPGKIFRIMDPKKDRSLKELVSEGYWWEHLTFFAIKNLDITERLSLNAECYIKKKTGTNRKGKEVFKERPLSEIDVLFSFRDSIYAVSCKTATKRLELDALELLSEAKKRLGRFTICLLSVPHKDIKRQYRFKDGLIVSVLTPKELINKEKFLNIIEEHLTSLKTTKNT